MEQLQKFENVRHEIRNETHSSTAMKVIYESKCVSEKENIKLKERHRNCLRVLNIPYI
jgi:DNA-directed RNA polymerase alpha subunit